MHRFIIYDNDGSAKFVRGLTQELYDRVRAGKLVAFQVDWDGQAVTLFNPRGAGAQGCWENIANEPDEPGLYMIQTDRLADFDITKVGVWTGDHWRTPQVGRIDGDNRIGFVAKWKGPLKWDT